MIQFKAYNLPEGYIPVTNIQQLYKLRKGKRSLLPENMVREVQVIYIYSEIEEGYYKRILTPEIPDESLEWYIQRGILFYKPKE
jgi:hypothetical protein